MSINLIKSAIYLGFCVQMEPFLFSARPASEATMNGQQLCVSNEYISP